VRGAEGITVLVVEDDEAIRELLVQGLRFEGYRAVGVGSLAEARRWLEGERPRAVILDLMLPDGSGLDLLSHIRGRAPEAAVLVVTAKDALEDRVSGLDRGADDYVVKPFAFPELLARLRARLRTRAPEEADLLEFEDVVLDRRSYRVTRGGQPIALSKTEFELLAFFMAHPGRVFSKDALLNSVWGYDFVGDANVVESYVSYLRDKLQDRERRLIQTVRGVGYRLGDG
jgi:two-component system OmpR family response regulator